MSVTGHHSINSLAIYQKVSSNEKMAMGMSINYFLNTEKPEVNAPLQPVQQRENIRYVPIAPKNPNTVRKIQAKKRIADVMNYEPQSKTPMLQATTSAQNIVAIPEDDTHVQEESEDPFSDMPNFDICEYIAQIEEETRISTQEKNSECTTTMSLQCRVKKSPNIPIFNNCKIGQINININKKSNFHAQNNTKLNEMFWRVIRKH